MDKGLLRVIEKNDELTLINDVSEAEEEDSLLKTFFEDGKLVRVATLQEIRSLINGQI